MYDFGSGRFCIDFSAASASLAKNDQLARHRIVFCPSHHCLHSRQLRLIIMALPRAYSLGRTIVSRGAIRAAGPAFLPGRITVPTRSFISKSPVLRDVAQNDGSRSSGSTPTSRAPVSEAVRKQNACSVKLLKVPRRVAKGVIEELFRDAGFDV